MELQTRMAPCSKSALWKEVRLEGLDLVRRCRLGLLVVAVALLAVGACPALVCRRFSGRPEAVSRPVAVPASAAAGSRTALLLRDASSPVSRRPGVELRPRRVQRLDTRPSPYHTNPTSHIASLPAIYAHHLTSTDTAMQNRMGSTVKVHSHASRHASAPNVTVLSRYPGSKRKFFSLSNFTALDSYGMSLAYEWWMYSGLGRCPASSSCNIVGMDMGGSGIEGGMGDGGRTSGSSFRIDTGSFSATAGCGGAGGGGNAVCVSRLRGAGLGAGWNEFLRFEDPREGG